MAKTSDPGTKALAFLAEQRLPPTPANYTVAYLHVTGASTELTRRIASITDGGVRLVQDQAEDLAKDFCGVAPPAVRAAGTAATHEDGEHAKTEARIRHQLLRIADVAATSGRATSEFADDLRRGLQSIDGEGLTAVVTAMIDRATRAEQELARTNGELGQIRQELETVRGDANRDELTGLYNRRALEAHLADTIGDKPRAIAFCDVDHFKSVNDRFGHGVGDRVLKQVATILQKTCSDHFVARWGGEEFVVCFYGLDAARGAALIDRARADMATRDMKLRENQQPLGQITFSAGVSDVPGHEQAIADADRLLYEAKNSGRNRVLFDRAARRAA